MTEGGNGDEGVAPFLAAEETLRGHSLAALVERARSRGERLVPELVAWIGARAAEGLRDVHALVDDAGNPLSVTYGAVTPENVFLTFDGQVVLAGHIDAGAEAPHGDGAGGYPEETADPRADVVALAATLYEAALGEPPVFEISAAGAVSGMVRPPSTIVPGFPGELAGILVRVLEEEHTPAVPSASELAAELDHFAGRNASEASLAELLAAWFEDERGVQPLDLDDIPALVDVVRSLPPGFVSAAPLAASLRPASHEKPSRWGLAVIALAVLLVAGSVLVVKLSAGDRPMTIPGAAAGPAPVPAAPAVQPPNTGIRTGTAPPEAEKGDACEPRFVP